MIIFNLTYWTNTHPGQLEGPELIIFILILLAFGILWILTRFAPNAINLNWPKTVYKKLQSFSIFNLIIASILFFLSYEIIPVLSMRFWFVLWGIGIVLYFKHICKLSQKIQQKKLETQKEQDQKKYLPK